MVGIDQMTYPVWDGLRGKRRRCRRFYKVSLRAEEGVLVILLGGFDTSASSIRAAIESTRKEYIEQIVMFLAMKCEERLQCSPCYRTT